MKLLLNYKIYFNNSPLFVDFLEKVGYCKYKRSVL